MGETLLTFITLVAMGAGLLLILIPSVPVSALQWAIAFIYAALTDFQLVTIPAFLLISVFMVIGSTAGLWMPFFGLRGRQLSCMGLVAFFIGMIIGGAVIPIPIIGSMIGGMVGVVIVEYTHMGDFAEAVKSGGSAMRLIIYSMIAEFLFASAIIATTLISILSMS